MHPVGSVEPTPNRNESRLEREISGLVEWSGEADSVA